MEQGGGVYDEKKVYATKLVTETGTAIIESIRYIFDFWQCSPKNTEYTFIIALCVAFI